MDACKADAIDELPHSAEAHSLPVVLVELVLAIAPHTLPRSTTYLALARVLAPSQVPLAYASIFARANSSPVKEFVNLQLEREEDSDAFFLSSNDAFLGLDTHVVRAEPVEILGQVERYLLQRPPTQALARLVRHCGRLGDWAVIDRVCAAQGELVRFLHHELLAAASEHGHVARFQALCSVEGSMSPLGNLTLYLLIGARNGHSAFIEYLLEHQIQDIGAMDMFHAIRLASIGGHVGVLVILYDRAGPIVSVVAWRSAAEYNHVHVLDWLHEGQVLEPAFGWVDWASKRGHLAVLDWFYENTDRAHYTPAAVEWASEEGRLDVIEWWVSKTDLVFKFSPGAMWQAHRHGHTLVSRFWDEYEPYQILIQTEFELTDAQAALIPRDAPTLASFGRLDLMLRFDLATCSATGHVSEEDMFSAIQNAALFGHIHVLEHFSDPNNNSAHQTMSNVADILISAALPGDRVNVVRWLVAKFPHADESYDWSSPLVELVELEARCVLEWMFRTGRCKPPVRVDVVKAACRVGDVAMLNLLFAKGFHVDALKEDDSALIEASRWGHVSVLQWWVRNRLPMPRSTRPVDYASHAGQRIVLDWWLYDCKSEFWWSEAAIRWAVERKHLKVAQWWLKSGLVKDSELLALLQSVSSPSAL